MLDLDRATFEKLVIDELDLLPDEMVEGIENVVFVTEDRPEDGSLSLFGLYPREHTPAIPPEFMLLGRAIYEMSSWTRAIVIPLAIVHAIVEPGIMEQ